MKLLFVGTDRDRAGGAAHFLSMVKAMADAGHRVEALADRNRFIAERLEELGLTWHHARFRNVVVPSAHRTLARTIRRLRPDWLIGDFGKEYWPLIVQGRLHGVPVALFRQRAPAMHRMSEYLLPRLAQRFIAVSEHARELFIERGMPAERVQVVYNPVDTRVSRPDPEFGGRLRDEFGIPRDAVVVGFVGRMYTGKGILVLQQALEQAMRTEPRLHALWIGEGPQLGDLRSAIEAGAHASRHHVAGWRADAARCYSAMSMLAFPTVMLEMFGRVSVEAQASGVPVLGSRTGGIAESLHDGETGLLLPPGKVDAWRDAILRLCADDERQRMGSAARAFIEERFSMPVVAREFADLLDRPAGDRPARNDA
jgi:glycosyltransferase involved in cell wall biosynthesis